jgi:hypothetical protein
VTNQIDGCYTICLRLQSKWRHLGITNRLDWHYKIKDATFAPLIMKPENKLLHVLFEANSAIVAPLKDLQINNGTQ